MVGEKLTSYGVGGIKQLTLHTNAEEAYFAEMPTIGAAPSTAQRLPPQAHTTNHKVSTAAEGAEHVLADGVPSGREQRAHHHARLAQRAQRRHARGQHSQLSRTFPIVCCVLYKLDACYAELLNIHYCRTTFPH